jgi:hypothetical protein
MLCYVTSEFQLESGISAITHVKNQHAQIEPEPLKKTTGWAIALRSSYLGISDHFPIDSLHWVGRMHTLFASHGVGHEKLAGSNE